MAGSLFFCSFRVFFFFFTETLGEAESAWSQEKLRLFCGCFEFRLVKPLCQSCITGLMQEETQEELIYVFRLSNLFWQASKRHSSSRPQSLLPRRNC